MAGSDRLMDCQTEAFPLEGKVANAMSRMRCSRRSGVIFLAMITAIAWPTPHHRLRRSLSSRRSLLVSASANYRHPPCLIITPPWQRTAQLDAGRAQHDRRGNIQGNGWRLRRSGHAEFSLPRGRVGRQVARATPCFHPIDYYVTHRFFVTFLLRPALLPYGKRGFRAAICKIARPQPPAAAL